MHAYDSACDLHKKPGAVRSTWTPLCDLYGSLVESNPLLFLLASTTLSFETRAWEGVAFTLPARLCYEEGRARARVKTRKGAYLLEITT